MMFPAVWEFPMPAMAFKLREILALSSINSFKFFFYSGLQKLDFFFFFNRVETRERERRKMKETALIISG